MSGRNGESYKSKNLQLQLCCEGPGCQIDYSCISCDEIDCSFSFSVQGLVIIKALVSKFEDRTRDVVITMAEVFVKGILRYSGRLLQKPLYEIRDLWHDVSNEEERRARRANFLAYMLHQAYVYYEKPDQQKDCIKQWDAQGYEIIPPEEFVKKEVKALLIDERCIVFALRKKRNRSGACGAGDVLVLIRGTVWSIGDVLEDISIVAEGLHKTKRVKRTEALVLELVERYGLDNVCLVGHSLGAAVAFLIARKYYLERGQQQTVEGHYFNLPFMCLETVVKELLHLCSLEYTLFLTVITPLGLNSIHNKLKDMLAGGSRNLLLLTETARKAADEFAELIDWTPNIYVNPNDRICKSYIDFLENLKQHGIGKSGMSRFTGLLKRLGLDAKTHHLCPSANLIITNKGISTLHSHSLKTWVNVKPRHIRIKSFVWNGDGRVEVNRKLGVDQTQLLLNNALRSHGLTRRH